MSAPRRSWGHEPGEHTCPGCAAPGIPNRCYACPSCWERLPPALQRGITASAVDTTWEGRMAALTAAGAFFERNRLARSGVARVSARGRHSA